MFILHVLLSLLMLGTAAHAEEDVSSPDEVLPAYREPSQEPRVGEITPEQQQRVHTRVQTLSLTSLSFGPSWGKDMQNRNMFYALHLGHHWEATTNAEIRLNLDAAIPSKGDGLWLAGTVGAGWLVSTENFSPVVGAEFGFGYAHITQISDPSGFVFGGFAGLRLFRTATTQMSVEGFFQALMDGNKPVLSGVRVGVLF
ncbi:MAG: hypothetical protein H6623_09500 [Bdellovibrionaceae bacterium]|nr:hypothetical protein [Pseudobdellovibrionaceae bacterium]